MQYPWFESYDSDVPHTIDINRYASILEIFEEAFDKHKNAESFYCMGKSYTYGELDLYSKKFASYLQNTLKLESGDRVALMMPNILQYPVALFGILRAGLVAVNVNPLYTARELEHQLNDAGAKAIVVLENSASTLQEVLDKTPVKHVLMTSVGEMLGFPKSLLINFVVRKVKKMVPAWDIPQAIPFRQAFMNADESLYKRPERKHDDIAFLQYTGGTTGVSKGAVLSHGNIVANVLQSKVWIKKNIEEGKETIITPLPLYHIFSLTANCLIFTTVGAKNVLITNPRDIPGFVAELKKHKFTSITGVNTLFNGLLANDDFRKLDFSHLKSTLGGGMAVQKAVADEWKKVTGIALVEAYGLTETSPGACINPVLMEDYNGKIGLPLPSTIVVIKDDDGNDVEVGGVGEICIKGPQVMQGYWNKPEETAKVMTADGFFRTGDIGTMDEKGYFEIVDRKKDMILVSGFNVFPNEVEDILVRHPGVFEAAAIGVPDDKSGEAVKVYIVKGEGDVSESDLKAYCKENLAGYKVPKLYEFREELPKTPVGKILRKALREEQQAQ